MELHSSPRRGDRRASVSSRRRHRVVSALSLASTRVAGFVAAVLGTAVALAPQPAVAAPGDPIILEFVATEAGQYPYLMLGSPGETVNVVIDWGFDYGGSDATSTFTAPSGLVRGDEVVIDAGPDPDVYAVFPAAGTYTVTISPGPGAGPWLTQLGRNRGELNGEPELIPQLNTDELGITSSPGPARLTRVVSLGDLGTTSFANAFSFPQIPPSSPLNTLNALNALKALTDIPSALPANVNDLSGMFKQSVVNDPDIGSWDVSSVTNMRGMFYGTSAFNQPLADWDVSSVTDFYMMFRSAEAFNQPIGNWVLSSSPIVMESMFRGTTAFNQPLAAWNVSSVTNMRGMFEDTVAFNQPLAAWNVSSVTNMERMFEGADAFDQPLAGWNVSNVTNMGRMFDGAEAFDQPLAAWDVSSVTNMDRMFRDTTAFDRSLGDWTLASTVVLTNMLIGSAMSVACYDATLIGWAAENPSVTGRTLGASGLVRSSDSAAAHATLTTTRTWTITDAGDGGTPGGPCPAPKPTSAAPTPSGPQLTVVTAPTTAGDPILGQVTGGDPGIDILWRLLGPDGSTLVEGPVTLDDSGAGTIATTLPSAATGGYRLVLVDWGAEDGFTLGATSGPVPTSVPAGEGPAVPVGLLAFGLLAAAGAVAAARRQATAG